MSNQPLSEPSMEQILASIRKIMAEEESREKEGGTSSQKDDILELTDMVTEDGSIVKISSEVSEPSLSSPEEALPALSLGDIAQAIDPKAQMLNPHLLESIKEETPEAPFAAPTTPSEETNDPAVSLAEPSPVMEKKEEAIPPLKETTQEIITSPEALQPESPKTAEAPPSSSPAEAGDVSPEETSSLLSQEALTAGVSAMASLVQATRRSARSSEKKIESKTIEEVIQDLLRPLLSEWLNQNLHTIVEKIVEKEIKKITDKAEDL